MRSVNIHKYDLLATMHIISRQRLVAYYFYSFVNINIVCEQDIFV
jgi:hypothetical protein